MKPVSSIFTWTSPSLPLTSTSPSLTTSPTLAGRDPAPTGVRPALPSDSTMTPARFFAAGGAACAGVALGGAELGGGVWADVAQHASRIGRQPRSERLHLAGM